MNDSEKYEEIKELYCQDRTDADVGRNYMAFGYYMMPSELYEFMMTEPVLKKEQLDEVFNWVGEGIVKEVVFGPAFEKVEKQSPRLVVDNTKGNRDDL